MRNGKVHRRNDEFALSINDAVVLTDSDHSPSVVELLSVVEARGKCRLSLRVDVADLTVYLHMRQAICKTFRLKIAFPHCAQLPPPIGGVRF